MQFVILERESDWHPSRFVAVVEADSVCGALAVIAPYITAPGDDKPSLGYHAVAVESVLYPKVTAAHGGAA